MFISLTLHLVLQKGFPVNKLLRGVPLTNEPVLIDVGDCVFQGLIVKGTQTKSFKRFSRMLTLMLFKRTPKDLFQGYDQNFINNKTGLMPV